jgi:nucleoside-diphosphate-sugar epimerase
LISNLAQHVARCVTGKIILVTGGAGTIGSAVARRLIQYDVKALRLLDHRITYGAVLDPCAKFFGVATRGTPRHSLVAQSNFRQGSKARGRNARLVNDRF